MKLVQYNEYLVSTVDTDAWCLSTRALIQYKDVILPV